MSVTEPIQIPIEGDARDFIADAKKVQEQMDILAHRLEKAGVSQAAYNKAIANSKGAITGQTDAVKSSALSITDLRSAYMIAADAARIAGQVWQATGQEFINYAEQVKDFSRSLGASAEETSKIIQVADDVRISTQSLKMAFKEAQKDGIEPNIEGLAKLSDAYLALPPGVERTQFAIDKFGSKAGPEMEKLLVKGSAAIRDMSDAVSENLIMTDAGIKASDDYQASLDTLKDSAYGVQVAFGAKITPVLNAFMRVVLADIEAVGVFKDVLSGDKSLAEAANEVADIINSNGFEVFGFQIGEVSDTVENDLNPALEDNADALTAQKEAVQGAKDSLKEYEDALDAVSKANQDMESMSRTIAEDQKKYIGDHNSAVADLATAEREYAEAAKEHGKNSEEALTKLGDIDIAKEGIQELEATWHESANNMIYDMVLVGLSAGGLLDSEQKALDEYAVKAGIKTQADIDEANRRREIADSTIAGILQSEDVLAEQRKVDAETLRLQEAITSAESITASQNEAAAIAQVSLYTMRETDNQALLAAKAKITAAAYASIKYPGGSSGGGGANPAAVVVQAGGIGGRDEPLRHATGGDFLIPMSYGNEGFRMGNGDTASGGERVTITPKGQSPASGATYNITINNPKKETAEASIRAAMKKIAYTGAEA